MAKFSEQVENLKVQTDLLRNNLTETTNIDCSSASIGICANLVNSINKQNEKVYLRPDWYPNIMEILNNAPDITVGNTVYYPAYIVLEPDTTLSEKLTQSVTNNVGTGADAYIFSDDVNNNILNANENTLKIGTTVEHFWDITKDITSNDIETYGVRWIVMYTTSKTRLFDIQVYEYTWIEIVTGEIRIGKLGSNSSSNSNETIKSVYMQDKTTLELSGSNSWIGSLGVLLELRLPKSLTGNLQNLMNLSNLCKCNLHELNSITSITKAFSVTQLSNIIIPENVETITDSFQNIAHLENVVFLSKKITSISNSFSVPSTLQSSYPVKPNLRALSLPDTLTTLNFGTSTATASGFQEIILPNNINTLALCGHRLLNYIELPQSITSFKIPLTTQSNLYYIKLFNNFNISLDLTYVSYTSGSSIRFLKSLCKYLKDNTNGSAQNLKFKTSDLDIASQIYLTYNAENKRDMQFDNITSETSGAISILEYLTNQLNWTIS